MFATDDGDPTHSGDAIKIEKWSKAMDVKMEAWHMGIDGST